MTSLSTATHRAAIGGYVRDALSGSALAKARIEILELELSSHSASDGFYHFLDLPEGAYTLRASAPAEGRCYGVVTTGVTVATDSTGRPLLDGQANLALPPTQLRGVVRNAATTAPIAQASIKMLASRVSIRSDSLGRYALAPLEPGTHSVQVAAAGYAAATQLITLTAGQSTTVDFNLDPG